MLSWQKNLNLAAIFILAAVLLGAFSVQFIFKAHPCPLCLLQRICMIGAACSFLLNLLFGIRMAHYGIALLFCLSGAAVALRQIALRACIGVPEFALPIFGFSLYTWSLMVFTCTVIGIAILLCLYRPEDSLQGKQSLNIFGKITAGLLLFVALTNIIVTFAQCGITFCHH